MQTENLTCGFLKYLLMYINTYYVYSMQQAVYILALSFQSLTFLPIFDLSKLNYCNVLSLSISISRKKKLNGLRTFFSTRV